MACNCLKSQGRGSLVFPPRYGHGAEPFPYLEATTEPEHDSEHKGMPTSPEPVATSDAAPAEVRGPRPYTETPPRSPSPSKARSHRRSASSVSIADSPLQQVNVEPAQHYMPKAVVLYEQLFQREQHSPGYWVEFFLLPVNKPELTRVTSAAQPLSKHEATVQILVRAAIANLRSNLPEDIILNALQVLEVIFSEALDLSVKTPTTQVFQVLAGLDRASRVFDDLTSELLGLLRHRSLAVVAEATQFVLIVARRMLGTSLNTLFASKNFFAAFIRVIDEFVDHRVATDAFTAIGVLTAVNMYDDDGAPVYKQRMSDYVDDTVMSKIIALVQRELSRGAPALESSMNSGIGSWFSAWFSTPATEKPETNSPDSDGWQILLSLYLFVQHNSIFAQSFASSPALITLLTHSLHIFDKLRESPLDYSRCWLLVLLLRRLTDAEFLTLVDPAAATIIRVWAPKLVLDTSRRVPMAGILDLTQIGLKSVASNKTPDFELLEQLANVLYQLCMQTVKTRTIWQYNWPQLWRNVISAIKHSCAKKDPRYVPMVQKLLDCLVGMSLHRDILDEEDWAFLIFRIVQNTKLFSSITEAFPQLAESSAIRAARGMIGQYELKPESPDFTVIVRQGKLATGNQPLINESLRPFSVHHEALLKKIVKIQVKSDLDS